VGKGVSGVVDCVCYDILSDFMSYEFLWKRIGRLDPKSICAMQAFLLLLHIFHDGVSLELNKSLTFIYPSWQSGSFEMVYKASSH